MSTITRPRPPDPRAGHPRRPANPTIPTKPTIPTIPTLRSTPPTIPPLLLTLLTAACAGSLDLTPSDAPTVLSGHHLDHPNPALPGPHEVLTLYYGSGTDKNRAEYRDSVTIVTEPVDASKLVSLGGSAESRNEYWGFSPDSFPLNARVWYPDDPGPHPLVLVVHGNHDMRDFSDPGYDWLGELLASRGYILASVDMNFINGGIRGENDGRGWLMLKHLQAWRGFADDPDNPFHGRVDMGAIGLIGHSRGGEAVALAAAFNRLARYPDDAALEFDFGFDIGAVIAIAPVDGQYLPAQRRAPVSDVNYLVFHGSHDGDVTSFHGLRQFNRVRFDGAGDGDGGSGGSGTDFFKSAVYVYRANHGQWNTVWGAHDNGPRSGRILELDGLLPPEDQREFGRVFVSSFLEITLKGDDRYRPIFRDHRVAGDWLPGTMYITRFIDSSFRPLADFEEDIDVTTGSAPGVTLHGADFSTWREGRLDLRSANRATTSSSQIDQALWLGWNNAYRVSDEPAPPAVFSVALPEGLARGWATDGETTLELHVGGLDQEPGPRKNPEEEEEGEEGDDPNAAEEAEQVPADEQPADEEKPPLDLTVAAVDADGDTARVALTDYGPLRRPLTIRVLRRRDLEDDRFANPWELILQHFSIPLSDFAEENPGFDPGGLRAVLLVFDRAEKGTVVVDDVGLARLHPGFKAARVPRG